MMKKIILIPFGILILAFISGCATGTSLKSLKNADDLIYRQTGMNTHLVQELTEEDARREMEGILKAPLSEDAVIKIAILNNPSVKAAIAGLGISRADMIEAGLLRNPTLSAMYRKSNEEGSKANTEFEVKQDVMSLLFWPLKNKLSKRQYKQAEYKLAQTIVNFIKDVRTEFYTWQGAAQAFSLRKDVIKSEEAALELAKRQKEAGNINILVLAEQTAFFQQAKIELLAAELEAKTSWERLQSILGLTTSESHLNMDDALPDLPVEEFSLSELEEKALNNRIDLIMKGQEIKILNQALQLTRLGVIPSLEIGFNTERETDGSRVQGPVLDAEIPVFNYQQGDKLRFKSQLQVSQRELEAMEAQARLEVRLAYYQINSTRKVVETYLESIPITREIVKQTLLHYNYMLKGVYDLLRTKQQEITTENNYITSLRDYWIARSELEHAVGMSFPVNQTKIKKTMKSQNESMPESEHQQHGGHQ